MAEIEYNIENKKEVSLVEKIIENTPWDVLGSIDNLYHISVDDKIDYEDFKRWYKEAKKKFK